MKLHCLFGFLLLFFFSSLSAQDYLGFVNSHFAGVNGIDVNPAFIVNNPRKWDVTIVGVNVSFGNNYIGLKKSALKKNGSLFKPDENTFPAFNDPNFQSKYLKNSKPKNASVFLSANITLPSFMFIRYEHKDGFAFTCRTRAYANVDGIDPTLAEMLYKNTGSPNADSLLFNRDFSSVRVSTQAMLWTEYGITYGKTVRETSHERLNFAGRLKFLQGIYSMYLFIREVNYKFYEKDSVLIVSSLVHYGHSKNLEFNPNAIKFGFGGKPSFGLDLGATYEFYPITQVRSRGKSSSKTSSFQHEYKYKIGFSVHDMGWITYLKPENARDFKPDLLAPIDFNSLQTSGDSPLADADDTLSVKYQMILNDEKFRMNLPTLISIQGDYYAGKNIYINSTFNYAFQFRNNEDKVHEITTLSITPRWDYKFVGTYVPLSYNKYSRFRAGTSLRLGPIILGTADLLPLVSKRDIRAADFHFMLKVPHIHLKKDKRPKNRTKFEVRRDKPKQNKETGRMNMPKKDTSPEEKERKNPQTETHKSKDRNVPEVNRVPKKRKHVFPKIHIFRKKNRRKAKSEDREHIIYFKL